MNTFSRYGLLWLGLLFVGYSAIAFLCFDTTCAFWISYVVTAAVFAVVGVVGVAFLNASKDPRRQLYAVALLRWSLLYLGLQILLSLLVMAFQAYLAISVIVCAYLLLFVAYGCLAIPAKAVAETLDKQDIQLSSQASPIRDLRAQAQMLVARCTDPTARQALEELSEALRFSDPVPTEATQTIEVELTTALNSLGERVAAADWAAIPAASEAFRATLGARNALCKRTKA